MPTLRNAPKSWLRLSAERRPGPKRPWLKIKRRSDAAPIEGMCTVASPTTAGKERVDLRVWKLSSFIGGEGDWLPHGGFRSLHTY